MDDVPLWGALLLQAVLIAVNAFFAAAEIAIVSLNESKVRKEAEEGDKKAKLMLSMVEMPTGFLSTIQVMITLAGFLGSAFAAESFSDELAGIIFKWFGGVGAVPSSLDTVAVILVTLILSYFTLVFGELVPKRIAMQRTEGVARGVCGVIRFFSIIAKPVVWFLSISTNAVLRILGVDPHHEEEVVTEDEIRLMVDISEESGEIEAEEKEMIENIFEFNNTTASEIMIHRTDIESVWVNERDDEILSIIARTGMSRFPVYDEDIDDIIGILFTRDFLMNLHSKDPKSLRELVRSAYFVPKTVHTDELFRDMQKNKTHMAIIVDEYGGTSGLVTLEDLLEEIVGNIYDEFDPQTEQDIIDEGNGRWRVAGGVELEHLASVLDIDMPIEDEEFDTLGGLVYSRLTYIPEDGSRPKVEAFGLSIQVEELVDRRVEWATVEILPKEEEDEESEQSERSSRERSEKKEKKKD